MTFLRGVAAPILLASVTCLSANSAESAGDPAARVGETSSCVACHEGIELIREPGSQMLAQIIERGAAAGDSGGCVVCHGGDPAAKDKELAHGGDFYADPGSPWINEQTCGQCHPNHVRVQWQSLMMTEAGKIQGVCWAFGSEDGYEHRYGNYAVENPSDPADRLGTDAYRDYMERLTRLEPNVFVDRHEPVPEAPRDLSLLSDHPELAGFTYLRQECQRCHHAVKGRQVRGDFRGMGCSSCHMPYSNEGFYEGGDPTIARDAPGHALVHSIQGTREAQVTVHDTTYSGIPVETCTTCHDRGKRIGVSFQGLMETPFESPYAADGEGQPALHTKHYLAMEQDVHYQRGMTCQDCHTTQDVHGDGFLAAANLASVQIECADCHGTPDRFPWELPLGFMDEFDEEPASGAARGVSQAPDALAVQGTEYPPRDGYLITARGNPYSNVVRDGDEVVVHTAAGADLTIKPLKMLLAQGALSPEGETAMSRVSRHLDRMECYSCHSAWTPQCYGCHVKIDYSRADDCPEANQNFDWVAAGRRHQQPEHAADRGESDYDAMIPGKVTEQRSYMRWEEPMLGVNGEGRITPLAPGCQVAVTIVGEDGETIIQNKIFNTVPGAEGGGEQGQSSIDMSPAQPHTTTKQARSCESCHASEKALGYGISGGRFAKSPSERVFVDLETVDGQVLSNRARPQIEPVEGLQADWSRIVTEEGEQLMTVGHHFQLSRPLNDQERARMNRSGTCQACHQEIPSGSLAVSLLHHVAEYAGALPERTDQHNALLHKVVLLSAWGQAGAIVAFPLGAAA